MRTFLGLPSPPLTRPTVLTVGNFDGVHRGHQALITDMLRAAHQRGRWAGVLTFDRHPLSVLAPERPLSFLTTLDERLSLLDGLGLDFVVVHPFTIETARTPAAEFVSTLTERLRLSELWVGPDFTLGRRREGHVANLEVLGEKLGFRVREVSHFCLNGSSVRSTRIRSLLHEGDVREAANLLGRPYRLWGHTIPGASLARLTHMPWVSVALEPQRVVPCCGLYAGWAEVQERQHAALLAISGQAAGARTEEGSSLDLLPLDFEGHLFGKAVALTFVDRLRPELHLLGAADPPSQISRDIVRARRVLGAEQSAGGPPLQDCPP